MAGLKNYSWCVWMLLPMGAIAADMSTPAFPSHPPFQKRALSALAQASTLSHPRPIEGASYISTVYFTDIAGHAPGNSAAGIAGLPAPIAGDKPATLIRAAGWVGRVYWYDAKSNRRINSTSEVFQDGVEYVAKITWTAGAPRVPTANKPSIPNNDARSGTTVNGAAPTYATLAANAPANQSNDGVRGIILPDLEGDWKAAVVKKPYNPAEQPAFNPPAGSPSSAMGNNNPLPGMNAAPMQRGAPLPALNVGDAGAGASIGATTTDLRFEAKNYLGHVGLNYLSPGSTYGLGVKADGAYLLAKTVALGTNLTVNNNFKEAVLSGVWMPEDTNLKAKLSGSYMVGAQSFGFYSGNSNANLSQASYYLSTDYVVPKEQSDYLHSVGVSTWGSKARQTNNPDPIYSVVNAGSTAQIMMDPLKLAVGTLQGEAVNAQAGLTRQIIAKVSAGYETLKFPFSDGSQELDKRIYQDYVVQYQPIPEVALQAGYKMGAAMNNIMLAASYGQYRLTGFKNNGVNGVTGNQGFALTYTVPLDGSAKAVTFGTLTRPELIGNSSYVLRDAATRPIQLPQTFLAKVDTTAVKMVASINTANLNGATVNAAGEVTLITGSGGGIISQVSRNGAPYAYASTISIKGMYLVINARLLPAASSSGDVYVISQVDSGGTAYLVTMNTQN